MKTLFQVKKANLVNVRPYLFAPGVAFSARVPVTADNRAYLRAVRQAELEAWQNAPGGTRYAR